MNTVVRVVGMFVLVLSANLNFLASTPNDESLLAPAPSGFLGFGKSTKMCKKRVLSPKLFYSENNLMKTFPNDIETSIASFKCVARKPVAFACSPYIDGIQYQGFDKTTRELIKFGINTHYDYETGKMIRYFWIEVLSAGERELIFKNTIVLEKDDSGSDDFVFDSLPALDAQESFNFIQKLFSDIFYCECAERIRFN